MGALRSLHRSVDMDCKNSRRQTNQNVQSRYLSALCDGVEGRVWQSVEWSVGVCVERRELIELLARRDRRLFWDGTAHGTRGVHGGFTVRG